MDLYRLTFVCVLTNVKGRMRYSETDVEKEYEVYEDTPRSFSQLEIFEHENIDELSFEEGQSLVYEVSSYIYGQYLIEFCRYVCLEGKYLKGVKLDEWFFDHFPRNTDELSLWMNELRARNININVKIGKEQSAPKKVAEGLYSVGKCMNIINAGRWK